jgi:hypothetical protein
MTEEDSVDNPMRQLDEWSRLYQAAIRIKEMAPWEWMSETDIFGVQNPETGEIGFVSIMGALGEHYAAAVYLGPQGLYRFWDFEEAGSYASDDGLLAIPHLQASFEDRSELTKRDLDVIKTLSLKFRGRQAWPMFRSYRPGYFPWYLEAEEARFLSYALEQTVDVASRFREDPGILTAGDEESYLVRVPQDGDTQVWKDQVVQVSPPEPATISVAMDVDALRKLKTASNRVASIEVDLFMFPARIGERGARPQCAQMLLVVESTSGMVLGSELLTLDPDLETMYGMVPTTVVRLLARTGIVPWEVRVRSELLLQLMGLLEEELGWRVVLSHQLPALDQAKTFMTQRLL